jgi:hypothetical protein
MTKGDTNTSIVLGIFGKQGAKPREVAKPDSLSVTATKYTVKAPTILPPAPHKDVVDGGNKDINGQLTSTKTAWNWRVSSLLPTQPAGTLYDKFEISDDVPTTAKLQGGYKVIDETGKEASAGFNIVANGNKITATAKDDFLKTTANYGHTYTLIMPSLVNIDDQTKTAAALKTENVGTVTANDFPQTTNHVNVTPKFNEASIKKQVSVDNGATWGQDKSLATHDSEYEYKIDYQLSDHADYTKIELKDGLESIQSVGAVKILDANGNDVTNKGVISGLPTAGGQTDGVKSTNQITWTANDPAQYTRNGGTFTMILSDVKIKGSTSAEDALYYGKKPITPGTSTVDGSGKLVIPNTATLHWTDKTPNDGDKGDQTITSDTTTVTPPNPTTPKAAKFVRADDTNGTKIGDTSDSGWKPDIAHNTTHDGTYQWKSTFNVSKFYNFTGAGSLTMSDDWENLQKIGDFDATQANVDNMVKQGAIKVVDGNNKDVTSKFDITLVANGTKTELYAKVKAANADDFDDVGGTHTTQDGELNLYVNGSLKGVDAKLEQPYVKGDKVTIPNIAALDQNSAIKEYTSNTKTNKVNIDFPTPIGEAITKQVSVDGGKTWLNDLGKLDLHDQNYIWKTNFVLTKFFNFTGAGSLTLTDHFEDLQKYSDIKIMQTQADGSTKDITDKFDISVSASTKSKNPDGNSKDIIAKVKAANANDFDDIGGTQDAKLANVFMYVNGSSLKGDTGAQEVKYLNADGTVTIPNQSTLDENSGFAHYQRTKDSNVVKVQPPRVEPKLDKYVEGDADQTLTSAIDANAASIDAMNVALDNAQKAIDDINGSGDKLSKNAQAALDSLVAIVADPTATATEINKSVDALNAVLTKDAAGTDIKPADTGDMTPLYFNKPIQMANKKAVGFIPTTHEVIFADGTKATAKVVKTATSQSDDKSLTKTTTDYSLADDNGSLLLTANVTVSATGSAQDLTARYQLKDGNAPVAPTQAVATASDETLSIDPDSVGTQSQSTLTDGEGQPIVTDAQAALQKAVDRANDALGKLDWVPTPYPDAVQKAVDDVIKTSQQADVTVASLDTATKALNDAISANIG